jgi:uncharacterized protein with HEPN domain
MQPSCSGTRTKPRDASSASALRNILIHGYASVDNRLMWGVVQTQLPQLTAALARLLAEP